MSEQVRVYTIGFTQKPAERFFGLLAEAGVRRLVDTRLRPGGQLAGFANGRDLPWLLDRLISCGYAHLPDPGPDRRHPRRLPRRRRLGPLRRALRGLDG
jgi:uncharacterized protein (DUF488 family)